MRRFARLVVAIVVLFAGVSPADAATFTVDSTADAEDANPGDGVCATAAGACTLRAAIQEANALPGLDIIVVPAGTYVLTLGELKIQSDLVIDGRAPTRRPLTATISAGFSRSPPGQPRRSSTCRSPTA